MEKMKSFFPLDLRALATMRIAMSCLLIADLFSRLRDFSLLYTSTGVFPGAGGTTLGIFLFLFCALTFLQLGLGFHTRLATLFSWIALVILQDRNPLVFQGADKLIRLTLLWGFFLPWGNRFSLDAKKLPKTREQYASWATFAFTLQIALLYLFAGLFKNNPSWRQTCDAVCFVLHDDFITTALAPLVARVLGHGCHAVTMAVPILEMVCAAALLVSGRWRTVRLVVVCTLVLLHVSFFLTLRLGLFPWIGMLSAVGLALLPEKSKIRKVPPALRGEVFAAVLVGYVVWINVGDWAPSLAPSGWFAKPVSALRLKQSWQMFTRLHDRIFWLTLKANDKLTLNYRGEAYVGEKSIGDLSPNQRWRMTIPLILFDQNSTGTYLSAICHRYSYATIDLVLWRKDVRSDYTFGAPTSIQTITKHCIQ